MDGLIDLILENPFFLVILIGGIISLLKGKAEKNKENQSTTNQPKPTETRRPVEQRRQPERTAPAKVTRTRQVDAKSIEELREEQLNRLSRQATSAGHRENHDMSKISDGMKKEIVHKKSANRNEKAFKKDFNQGLTSKGLVNSVIMAEVLGAPRSRGAYQTVITKRRKRL